MQSKNWVLGLIVLVLLAAGAVYLSRQAKPTPPAENAQQQEQEQPPQVSFTFGEVSKVEGQQIYYVNNGVEAAVTVGAKTKLVKQIAKSGGVDLADAALSDFKKGSRIVIYPEVSGSDFTPDKIQIIN